VLQVNTRGTGPGLSARRTVAYAAAYVIRLRTLQHPGCPAAYTPSPGGGVVTRGVVAVLVGLMIVTGASCSSTTDVPGPATSSLSTATSTSVADPPADERDSAGEAACTRFRDVASGAFGESMSKSEVVSGLKDVGDIAADSTNPAITDNAEEVAAEANAGSMISGTANGAQDALADACNDAYPI